MNPNTPFTTSVTLTFDREVSNLSFIVQDIDKGTFGKGTNVGGSDFTDEVAFYALNGAGNRVSLLGANVAAIAGINAFVPTTTINGLPQEAVRGTGLNGTTNGASRTGNVRITFTSPVKSVMLTLRNLNTYRYNVTVPVTDPIRLQTVAFEQISWCSQADLTTTISPVITPIAAGTQGAFNVSFANPGDISTGATTARVLLPTGLTFVSATNGGTYDAITRFVTYPNTTAQTYNGAPLTSVITVLAPTAGTYRATASITSGTTEGPSADPNPNTNTADLVVTPSTTISGTIFDDVNYGGGSGRTLTTASSSATASGLTASIGSVGTTVELYRSNGTLAATTTTTAGGAYSFIGVASGTYTVRVVNSTVKSARGAAAAAVAVQTFRTENGVNDANRVGGEAPEKIDAAANTGNQLLSALTSGTGATSLAPESISTVTVAATPVAITGVDFGFNFDTVVNTRDAGQGSLRQFILNSNLLGGENTLAQAGSYTNSLNLATGSTAAGRAGVALPAGVESSIFMIPANRLTNGVAFITPTTALPQITGANTAINGSTQTFNIGNSNDLLLGAGGTVGTALTTLNQLNGPEVQLIGTQNIDGISVAANNTTVRGLSIYGFNTGVRGSVDNQGTRIDQNVIGASAISFTDPTGTNRNLNEGVNLNGSDNGFVTNNLIGFNGGMGVWVLANGANGANDNSITGNEIRGNGLTTIPGNGERLVFDGLELQGNSTRNTVSGNLITASVGHGIDSFGNDIGGNTVSGNTISNNGVGVANGTGEEGSGLRVFGTTNPTSISRNVLTGNNGSGVLLVGTANQVRISENSTSGNTRLGIDLLSAAEGGFATAPGTVFWNGQIGANSNVTLNDNGDGDGGGNGLLNFPVLTTATLNATTLVINGFARPGSLVELFLATPLTTDPTGNNRNFGQGSSFLASRTEGNNAEDTNTGVAATYGPGTINGISQGTDTTVPFTFSIALNTLTPAQRVALLSGAATLTSTATLANSTSEFSGNLTLPVADVTTVLTGPTIVSAGQPTGTYLASFTNNGPSTATDVTQKVTLPAGADITAQLADIQRMYPGTTLSNGVLYFGGAPTTLASGATNSFSFAFTAANSLANSTLISNVTTATNQGANTALDAASLSLTTTGVANVRAQISGNGPIAAGATATFTATLSNAGPQQASDVVATVQLPTGLQNLTVTPPTGYSFIYNQDSGLLTFIPTGGSLGTPITLPAAPVAGSSLVYTIAYTQPAAPVTATASISTSTNEAGQTANNSASATIAPNTAFDVATTISGPASTTLNGQVAYNVTTTNRGTSPATNVVQTVTLPAGATNVFVTGNATISGSTVTFPAIASLIGGQTVNNTVSFTAPAPATGSTSYAVTAAVTPTAGDADNANNTSTATTTVTAPPVANTFANAFVTISVAATATPGTPVTTVDANTSVTFTVTEGNNGRDAATGVVTRTALPTGLPITGAQALKIGLNGATPAAPTSVANTVATYAGGITYDSSTGIVTSGTTTTQPTGSASYQTYALVFNAPATGIVTATADVSTTTIDNVVANNVATTQVTVNPAITDVTTALIGPSSAVAGALVNYTVTTTNNGPVPAANVVQSVAIQAGLPLTGATALSIAGNSTPTVSTNALGQTIATYSAGTTYNQNTGLVTFVTITSQVVGNSVSNTIAYFAPSNGNGNLTAVASVSTTSAEIITTNNSDIVATTLQASTDMQVVINGPASTFAGDRGVTYTVVTTNNGPSTAATSAGASVVTTVQLPAGLNNVVVRGTNGAPIAGAYDNASGLVTFDAQTNQAPGSLGSTTGSITFDVPTNTNLLQPTATVSLTGTPVDAIASNNTATIATTVKPASATPVNLTVSLSSSEDYAGTVTNPASIAAGSPVTFIVTSRTNTATAATNLVQTLQLLPGLALTGTAALKVNNASPSSINATTGIATYPDNSTYNPATGLVTFAVTNLNGNSSVINKVTVVASGITPLVGTAVITADQSDLGTTTNVATRAQPISSTPDVATAISGPAAAAAGATVSYTVVTSNAGLGLVNAVNQTVTLPATVTSYSLNGGPFTTVAAGATVALPVPATLYPGAASSVSNVITFLAPATGFSVTANATATNDAGTTGNNASVQPTTIINKAPIAAFVVNSLQAPESNTAGQLFISPLRAIDPEGNAITYRVTTAPAGTQGILYYNDNGTYRAVADNQPLTSTQAATLKFDPAAGFVGNASFLYTASDNSNAVSNTATYLIPVGTDNAAVYTSVVRGGNANQYQNNDVVAYGIDPNGAVYNTAGLIYNGNTGTAAAGIINDGINFGKLSVADSTTLAAVGIRYTSNTGLFTVVDRNLLPRVGRTIRVTITTLDLFGGISTLPFDLILGQNPLPVELVAFTATALKNVDAVLVWRTASEKNNDHFEVERSLNGTDYVQIGRIKGQGATSLPTDYTLTDAGIGAKTPMAYYRLKQVDTDGTSTYSPVRTVAFTKALVPAIALYPNPATATTKLDLTQLPTGTYQVSVLDATGRVVLASTLQAGLAHALDLNTIAAGTYTVLVRGQAVNLTKRLIKE